MTEAMREGASGWTPREDLLAGRIVLPFDPAGAVRRAIARRIPDADDERSALDTLVREAVGRRPNDDDLLAEVSVEAVEAGLELGPLLSRVVQARAAHLMDMDPGRVRRLHLVVLSLRPRLERDPEELAAAKLCEKKESDQTPPLSAIADRNANIMSTPGIPSPEERVARARAWIRKDEPRKAEALLEGIPDSDPDEQLTLARIELRAASRPLEALAELGNPASDTFSRRLTRAAIESRAAEHADDEHARQAESYWIEAIKRDRHDYWLQVYAHLSLVRLEEKLGRLHQAHAWFARGRIDLDGGGDAFDEEAVRLFSK